MKKKEFSVESLSSVDVMLNHPAIKDAWLCTLLYGNAGSTNRPKFCLKKAGANGKSFTEEERAKLEQIRLQLLGKAA